jgi:HK97 family phage major capsid protein
VELIDHGGHGFRADTITEDPASGGALIIPQYLPGIVPILFKRLVIADLMASGLTDSNAIIYMQETNWTSAAAPVLEGADKPESKLTFASVTDNVRKIAHWLPVSEEMLEDVAQIASYIDARLRLGVQIEEEDQLLNGTGVAPELLGLLLRPGLAAPYARVAPVTNSDAILTQMMTIFATSFLMPDGIVMNPANWAATILTKTTTGEYLTAGPFSPIQTPTMWGVPVAVTPSAVAGSALVGAFKQASQVFRKGGIRVEASNSHVDFFIKNLVAIRAEERLALAVYRPGAFGEVTGLA